MFSAYMGSNGAAISRTFDEESDIFMGEECDTSRYDTTTTPVRMYNQIPSSPTEECVVVVEDQRKFMRPRKPSLPSSSSRIVRTFSPPRRISWREHMRELHRKTLDESVTRLSVLRGGIDKRRKGRIPVHSSNSRRMCRSGCAMHVWDLMDRLEGSSSSSSQHCICGGMNDVIKTLSAVKSSMGRFSSLHSRSPHRFTYSYQISFDSTLDPINEDRREEDEEDREIVSTSSISIQSHQLGNISRSVSPDEFVSSSRAHCTSPSIPNAIEPEQTPVISEEEMCARLSALPIGYHTTTTVAALENALHHTLTLMDTDPVDD